MSIRTHFVLALVGLAFLLALVSAHVPVAVALPGVLVVTALTMSLPARVFLSALSEPTA